MSEPTDDAPPSLRKPSQAYVDSYIARRGEAAAARTPGPVTPSGTTEMSTQPPKGRHAPRIFYKLERHCPEHYYPKLHTSTFSIQMMRAVLLVLCVVQLAVAFAIHCLVGLENVVVDHAFPCSIPRKCRLRDA